MPIYRCTLKHSGNCNTIPYEKGMSVDVITPTTTNPLLGNGGKPVADAFMRIYGIDAKKAGILNSSILEIKMI